jgi:DNA primase
MDKNVILPALEDAMGSYVEKDEEYIFTCPNEDCPSRQKGKKKLQVNIQKNLFHCWVCEFKGRSLVYLVRYLNLDPSILGLDSVPMDNELETELADTPPETQIHSIIKIPDNYELIDGCKDKKSNNYLKAAKYLSKRGVSSFDIVKYRIHYQTDGYSILIPSYNENGDCNTYFVRGILDGMKYIPPFPRKNIVANELFVDWKEKIYLVEGFFDAITAGDNAIPLLGSFIKSDYLIFEKILQNRPECVILALDRDAFEKKTLRIASLLHKHEIPVKLVIFPNDNDINDIGRKEFMRLVEDAEVFHNLYILEHELDNI